MNKMAEKLFKKALVVSRHNLLEIQKKDIETITEKYDQIPELPTDPAKLREIIKDYDAVVSSLPINLIQMIQQNGKKYITFSMRSLGTFKTMDELNKELEKYDKSRIVILTPSSPNELYRMLIYEGLKEVSIKVEEKDIIKH